MVVVNTLYDTRDEMERLTAGWRPYRSYGSYYMWKSRSESWNKKK